MILKKTLIAVAAFAASAILTSCGPSVKVDKEFMAAIKAAAANCKVDTRYTFVKDCKNNENEKLEKMAEDRVTTTLGTTVVALSDKDVNVQTVACGLLYRKYMSSYHMEKFKKDPTLLTDGLVQLFLDGVNKMQEYRAFYAVQALTAVVTIKGGKYVPQLYKMMETHSQKNEFVRDVYPYLLKYGRLQNLDKIKELAKSGDKEIRWAALYAPRNMGQLNDAEKQAICPWLSTYIEEPEERNLKNVVTVLSAYCGGKYRDMALTTAEKREKLDQWFVYDAAAFDCGVFRTKDATDEQCKRREALRKKVGIK